MNLKHTLSKLVHLCRRVETEALIWCIGLIALAFLDPNSGSHFSICPLHAMGITWCPGCGLGRSVSFLLHGQVRQSLLTHPLGIVSLPVLLHRIVALTSNRYELLKSRFRH